MQIGSASHVGRVRERNEDALHVDVDGGLVIVADGLGGHPAGEVASHLAVDHIVDRLEGSMNGQPDTELVEALLSANRAILEETAGEPSHRGMGTTAVLAYIHPDRSGASFAHVGDSRAYVFREGDLIQVTEDHTAGGPMERGRITQALGTERGVEPDAVQIELERGDRILLCTDGLTDMLDDHQITETLADGLGVQETCDRLVKHALSRGGVDNITLALVDIEH